MVSASFHFIFVRHPHIPLFQGLLLSSNVLRRCGHRGRSAQDGVQSDAVGEDRSTHVSHVQAVDLRQGIFLFFPRSMGKTLYYIMSIVLYYYY